MAETVPLQQILGIDKKNPFFTLCRSAEQPGKLLVFFGMSLLEVVDDDPDSPSFKLLLARLYNAKIKPQALLETFPISYTSLCRWGAALKSGDSEKLISVLAGRQHPRKLSTEILGFAETRFHVIYPDNSYSYSKVIRQEILETFSVQVSGESLRPYFREWRLTLTIETIDDDQTTLESLQPIASLPAEENPKPVANSHPTARDELSADNESSTEQPEVTPLAHPLVPQKSHHESGQASREVSPQADSAGHNRKHAVVSVAGFTPQDCLPQDCLPQDCLPQLLPVTGRYQFCHHAGVLLFSGRLNELRSKITTGGQLIMQWLTAILLGAVNIEQTKLLNYPSLECFIGQVKPNRQQQRQGLAEIAQTSCVDELLQLNGQWAGIGQGSDFYYDPHSKHYTGVNKLLKGWCSRLRFAEKVLHMDFIHTPTGAPVYLSHDDNYLDLRERFFDVVTRFRQLFDFASSTPLTFVLDRGIYGLDTFERLLVEQDSNHFITWEKGFRADQYQDLEWSDTFSLYRAKNSSKDLKRYQFSYRDQRWSRQNDIRQIVVKATNPKNRSITVAILCSDLQRCASGVIALMFDRWIQENDFKYLDVHFGINEITSYATISYREMAQHLKDKQEKNGIYKALEKQRIRLKSQLKTQLLNEHRAKNKNRKRQEKITELTQQLNRVEEAIAHTEKEVSRLQTLMENNFQKLDTAKKSVMDGVKILARNLFYDLLSPFKKAYDNYRDDHMLLRHLTRSPGLIRDTGERMEVLLIPQACFPPKVTRLFHSMLATFNQNQPCMPDGPGRKLTIHLLQNNKELVEMSPTLSTEADQGKAGIQSRLMTSQKPASLSCDREVISGISQSQ